MAKEGVNSEVNPEPSLAFPPSTQSSSSPSPSSNSNASELHHLRSSSNQLPASSIVGVRFLQQPPDNLRKSNFFSFSLSLLDRDHQPITVKSAKFIDFIEDIGRGEGDLFLNGTSYKLLLKSAQGGVIGTFPLFLRVVDSLNKQLVAFEGTDKNPDFRRVLLTHHSTCARCAEGKSCGNRKGAPANPLLEQHGTVLKFFLRCNQNGAHTGKAGRPRSCIQRKFQVQVQGADRCILGYSAEFFVHNSSKYGRVGETSGKSPLNKSPKRGAEECKENNPEPALFSLSPLKGTAGSELILLGENFTANFDYILIGNVPVKPALLLPHALKVVVPGELPPGPLKVKLVSDKRNMVKECPVPFTVTQVESQSHSSSLLNEQIQMLGQMLPANFTSRLGRPLTSNAEILNQIAWFLEWYRSTECNFGYPSSFITNSSSVMISPPYTPPSTEERQAIYTTPTSFSDESWSSDDLKTYTTLTTPKHRYDPYPRPPQQQQQQPFPSRFQPLTYENGLSQGEPPKNCSEEAFAPQWRPN